MRARRAYEPLVVLTPRPANASECEACGALVELGEYFTHYYREHADAEGWG